MWKRHFTIFMSNHEESNKKKMLKHTIRMQCCQVNSWFVSTNKGIGAFEGRAERSYRKCCMSFHSGDIEIKR